VVTGGVNTVVVRGGLKETTGRTTDDGGRGITGLDNVGVDTGIDEIKSAVKTGSGRLPWLLPSAS